VYAHAQRGYGGDHYYQHTAAVTIPAGNQFVPRQHQPPQQRAQKAGYQVRGKGVDRQFDRPPVAYALLLKRLKDFGLVRPRMLAPLRPDQRPASYDENAKCEFHSGAPGHNVENCKAFKHIVQDLVDSKAINFAQSPNVNANHMPAHGQMGMNAISEDRRTIGLMNGDQLKAPMSVVQRPLMKNGDFPGCDNCCAAVATNGCVMMRETTQRMMEVEMDGEKFETPCQAVETVKVENAIIAEKERKSSISSYKQAVEVVRNGGIPGWGRMVDIAVKADRFGIGYQESQDPSEQNRRRRQPFTFISVGMLDLGHACAVGEEIDSDCELDSWIKSCVPGNWKASKIITVTHHEE
jgi:hypothetical protein